MTDEEQERILGVIARLTDQQTAEELSKGIDDLEAISEREGLCQRR